jgi:hypothetical protein
MHVEEAGSAPEGARQLVDSACVAAFGDVGNRLERQHGSTLGAVEQYDDCRAGECADWDLRSGDATAGGGRFRTRHLAGRRFLSSLEDARTLPALARFLAVAV